MQNNYTAPVIERGLDYVVIGTKAITGFGHRGIVPAQYVPNVVNAMEGVKALRAEVLSKDSRILNDTYPAMSLEQLTIACVKPADWQPLAFTTKDGLYWSDVVQPYGIPLEVFEMTFLIQAFGMDFDKVEQFLQNPKEYIAKHETEFSNIIKQTDGRAHHGELDYRRAMKNIFENNELLFFGLGRSGRMPICLLLFHYMSFIREYEIWKPDIEKMRSDYPNEKVAVMGGGRHVDFFVDVLKGESTAKPRIEALRLYVPNTKMPMLDGMFTRFAK